MLKAWLTFDGAMRKTLRFSNFTLSKAKNWLMNFKSNTRRKPPELFSTKKLLDTYYYFRVGGGIQIMAPEQI
jgi:hypothetical protein